MGIVVSWAVAIHVVTDNGVLVVSWLEGQHSGLDCMCIVCCVDGLHVLLFGLHCLLSRACVRQVFSIE